MVHDQLRADRLGWPWLLPRIPRRCFSAAPGSGTLRRLPPKHRAEGTPNPASRRLARAELLILGVRDFYFCREIRRTTVGLVNFEQPSAAQRCALLASAHGA